MGHPHKDLAWFKRSPKNIDLNFKTTFLTDRQFVCQTMILAIDRQFVCQTMIFDVLTDNLSVKQ